MTISSLIGGLFVRYFESSLVLSYAAIGFLMVGLIWLFNKKLRNLPNSEIISYKDFNIPKELIDRYIAPLKRNNKN